MSINNNKRKKVNCACLPCIKSKSGCDSARPCLKCVKRGIADQCVERVKNRGENIVQAIVVEDLHSSYQSIVLGRVIIRFHDEEQISVNSFDEFLRDSMSEDHSSVNGLSRESSSSDLTIESDDPSNYHSQSRRVSSIDEFLLRYSTSDDSTKLSRESTFSDSTIGFDNSFEFNLARFYL
jgi:hypothetical protein